MNCHKKVGTASINKQLSYNLSHMKKEEYHYLWTKKWDILGRQT